MKTHSSLQHYLHLTLMGVSLVLAWGVVTGHGLFAEAHAQEEENCVAYTIIGYTDQQQNFHTITLEPGNCLETSTLPLLSDLIG